MEAVVTTSQVVPLYPISLMCHSIGAGTAKDNIVHLRLQLKTMYGTIKDEDFVTLLTGSYKTNITILNYTREGSFIQLNLKEELN